MGRGGFAQTVTPTKFDLLVLNSCKLWTVCIEMYPNSINTATDLGIVKLVAHMAFDSRARSNHEMKSPNITTPVNRGRVGVKMVGAWGARCRHVGNGPKAR